MATYNYTSRLRTSELYRGGTRGGSRSTMRKHGDYTIIMWFDGEYPGDKRHASLNDKSVANIAEMLQSGITSGGTARYGYDVKGKVRKLRRWPFWKKCKEAHMAEWISAVHDACDSKKGSIYTDLLKLAYRMKGDIKSTIVGMKEPELSDKTIHNKLDRGCGLSKATEPLQETDTLLNSVQTLVVKTSSLDEKEKYVEKTVRTRPYAPGRKARASLNEEIERRIQTGVQSRNEAASRDWVDDTGSVNTSNIWDDIIGDES